MADSAQNDTRERVPYAVLGCGSTGYHVLQELRSTNGNLLVIDKNDDRVRELRDQGFDAVRRNISDANFLSGLPVIEIAFILSGDSNANLSAVRAVRDTYPHARIMARASDPLIARKLEEAGADFVLNQNQLMAKAAVFQINKVYANQVSRRLFSLLASWEGTLGIVAHTNPDPDAISSALALAVIANKANPNRLVCRIFYDGIIGHQANRTLVNLLEIKMEKMDAAALQECTYLAIVDSPAPGINNALPQKARVQIVIDHHLDGKLGDSGTLFVDSRPGLGATASILSQYLQELDISVDKRVATGLLYGIRSDTRDFSRNITPQDLNNAAFLLPLTDSALLDQIMSPSLSEETLTVLGTAIARRTIQSGYLFSNVGYIRNRDALPQAADLLISLEGVNTAIVYGISDEAIIISARNRDVRLHIGHVLQEAFGAMGDAGGHPTMAAATIPLSYFHLIKSKEDLLTLISEPLISRFTDIVGLEKEVRNGV